MHGHRTTSVLMYSGVKGVRKDYAEAFKWYRKAAEQEYTEAEFNLGSMYDNGQGIPQDYVEAVMWYRKAAEKGHARAQFKLGRMYQKGKGIPKNRSISYMWYVLAEKKLDMAIRFKRSIKKNMTRKELTEAGKLLREFKLKKTLR